MSASGTTPTFQLTPPVCADPNPVVTTLSVKNLQRQANAILVELAQYHHDRVPFIERMAWYDKVVVPIISLREVNRLAIAIYTQHWSTLLAYYPLSYLEVLREYYESQEEYLVCARIQEAIMEWVDFNNTCEG